MKTTYSLISLFIAIAIISCQNTTSKFNEQLAQQLDSIYNNDQNLRVSLDSLEEKYGYESPIVRKVWDQIHYNDSINLLKVVPIIDKYGWLGPDEVGEKGNSALFLVIQHSNLQAQEKYLPLMKEAVKKGNANGADLALLVDRIEMFSGRPQIYGSQIQMKDDKYFIYPIIDEINVNKRRAEVGLQPLEEYAKIFKIEYNLPIK